MHEYKDRALAVLQRLPDNAARESLSRLLIYAIERKK
jgi:hypothetical protein